MTQHVLDMVVRMQTGDVITGLDGIENQLVNMAQQISDFKPPDLIGQEQVQAYEAIQDSLKTSSKLTGLVTSNNFENYETSRAALQTAVETTKEWEGQKIAIEGSATAAQRLKRMDDRRQVYLDKSLGLIESNRKIVEKIVKGRININKLSKTEIKDVKEIAKYLKNVRDHGDGISDKYKEFVEHTDTISDSVGNIEKKTGKWSKHFKEATKGLGSLIPGLSEFAALASPLVLLGNQMKSLNDVYEKNHTVNNLFLSDSQKGVNQTMALSKVQREAAHDNVLTTESAAALNAILAEGVPHLAQNAGALTKLTYELASTARATGISETALADLILRTDTYGKSIGRTTRISETLINVQAKNNLTTSQMSKITTMLSKNLITLDKNFKTLGEDGTTGTNAIATSMGAMAKAARDAGADVDLVMDAMMLAIEKPLSIAPLLQDALFSDDAQTRVLAMGKNAEFFADMMHDIPQAFQEDFAKGIGMTAAMLDNLSITSKKWDADVLKLAKTYKKSVDGTLDLTRATKELTAIKDAASAADKLKAKEDAEAGRIMAQAWDDVIIVFKELAEEMQPTIVELAKFIKMLVDNKWSAIGIVIVSAVAGISAAIIALGAAIGILGKGIGAGMEGAGKGVSGFMKQIGKIDAKKALMGALAIAAVGVAFALGVGSMAYAITIMPPDKIELLGIMAAGLLAMSYLLVPLGKIGKQALMGALAVGATGVALAVGIWALGKAIAGMTMGKIKMLGILAAGLYVMTGLLALIGIPAVAGLALVGAATVMAVSLLLAGSIAVLSLVAGGMQNIATGLDTLISALAYLTPQMGEALIKVGAGLVIFAAAMTGAAVADMFGADMVGQAWKFAEAMTILEPPIASLAAMGEGAANAFKSIGQGLLAVSDALSGGGALDFFSGDTVENAKGLAVAMGLVAKPISAIGAMGYETAKSFNLMAVALQTFVRTLQKDAGWWDSFEERAADISKAMAKLQDPMQNAGKTEEIKSSLALSVDQSNKSNNDILDKLEEIREAIEEGGGITGGGDGSESLAELRKTSAVLERMLSEMSMGSSFGVSMADSRYNT